MAKSHWACRWLIVAATTTSSIQSAAVIGRSSVAWVSHADPVLADDVAWAIAQWSEVITGVTEPLPMSFTVVSIGTKHTMGTFTGCARVCTIRIDPKAFPNMVRVVLMHEIGHALGFTSGIGTPFGRVAAEFGRESGLWVDGAHWSSGGAGLLMDKVIDVDSRLSASTVWALAPLIGGAAEVCVHNGDCKSSEACVPRPKRSMLPARCTHAPSTAGVYILLVVVGFSVAWACLLLV
jgi:hypothetical protein